jgi:hypothetical protein
VDGPSIRRRGSRDGGHRRPHSRRAARRQPGAGGSSRRPGPGGVRRRPDSNSATGPSTHRRSHRQRAPTNQAVRRPAAGRTSVGGPFRGRPRRRVCAQPRGGPRARRSHVLHARALAASGNPKPTPAPQQGHQRTAASLSLAKATARGRYQAMWNRWSWRPRAYKAGPKCREPQAVPNNPLFVKGDANDVLPQPN